MVVRLAGFGAYMLVFAVAPAHGQSEDWAVWTNTHQQPHHITVAPLHQLPPPWELESEAFVSKYDAWKRACWLTKNGGIYGQKYESTEILNGQITCDNNCNCAG